MSIGNLHMSNYFSKRLIELRGDRRQSEFARFLGIPAPMYHRYEKGQIPRISQLTSIAEKCGITIESLLEGNQCVQTPSDDVNYLKNRISELERKLLAVNESLSLILQGTKKLQEAIK